MGDIAGNLVAQSARRNNGNLVADSLVGIEVEGQSRVEPLDDALGGLLHGLCSNATHLGCLVWMLVKRVVARLAEDVVVMSVIMSLCKICELDIHNLVWGDLR